MALSVEQLTMYQEFYKDGAITKELRRVILGLPEPATAVPPIASQSQQAAAEPLQSVAPIVQTTTPTKSKKARKRAAQKAKKQATTKANKTNKKQAAIVAELPAAVPVVAQPIAKQSQQVPVPVPTEAVAPIGFVQLRNVKGSNKQRLRDYKLDAPNSPYAASIGDPHAFGHAINSEAVTLIRDTMTAFSTGIKVP